MNVLKLVSASVCAANHAGRIIRDIMRRGDLGIVDKASFEAAAMFLRDNFMFVQGINDLQTEADRSAQRCIVSSLQKSFPNVAVIGEEVNC